MHSEYPVTVKSTVEISQNFVAFSEYMNFISRLNENHSVNKDVHDIPVNMLNPIRA